jgi:hypothetical protein
MSDTTAIILVFMAGILLLAGCVASCAIIGRYYARICIRRANYCAEVDERLELLMDEIVRAQNMETDVIPVARHDSESARTGANKTMIKGSIHGCDVVQSRQQRGLS